MNTKQEQMNKEKLQEEINKEMGYVSALFMSQGDTRAGDIVMPSTEILESVDRIMLYISSYIQSEIDLAVAEREKEIVKELTEELDMSKMLEGFERYWQKHTSGRYIERCIECGNTDKILRVLSLITKEN